MSAWSYSSLTAFETCPRRYAVVKVYKQVQDPPNEQAREGDRVHKALEAYGENGTPLPEGYLRYKPLVDAVLAAPGVKHFETKFALTEDLKPTTFFGEDVWVRGILDLRAINANRAGVLDWKTGKPKTDNSQLELFAVATMALHEEVDTVRSGFVWLAHNRLDREVYRRADSERIWSEFRARVDRLDKAVKYDEFPPKQSGLCRNYCPVPRRICEFSGKA